MILKYWILCCSSHINTNYAAVIQLNNAIYKRWDIWRFCLLNEVQRAFIGQQLEHIPDARIGRCK